MPIIKKIIKPKLSDFSLFITSKILDSCFRRNDDYHSMNENVIPVKTGIQKGLSLIIILRIAQFRLKLVSLTLVNFLFDNKNSILYTVYEF